MWAKASCSDTVLDLFLHVSKSQRTYTKCKTADTHTHTQLDFEPLPHRGDMLLKRQRVTQQASLQVAPPPPQPVFLVEDDLEEERRAKVQRTDDDFSPLLSGLEDGTPEPGYVPPMLSYTSLVKRALCPAGSPRDKSLTKDSPQDKTSPEPVQATSAATKSEGPVRRVESHRTRDASLCPLAVESP